MNTPPRMLLIDNYDSFTYNLVQAFAAQGAEVLVFRNDAIDVASALALAPTHLVISPGPGRPEDAGVSLAMIGAFSSRIPLLGVCLGHQSMGQAFGGTIVRAKNLMHGKTDMIHHDGKRLFAGLENPFQATRYHSLVIRPDTLSPEFEVTAWAEEPGGYREIMGIAHRQHPLFGVQFHPESFLTHAGFDILRAFLAV